MYPFSYENIYHSSGELEVGWTTQRKGKLYAALNHMIDVASYWAYACQKTADLWHLRCS